MARTVSEIQALITTAYVDNMAEIGYTVTPTAWSATNLIRLLIYVVSFCTYTLETIFDIFTGDVDEAIAKQKPHTLRWYAEKSKAFQYGYDLQDDSDLFDNADHSDDEVEESKIVDYAAVVEQSDNFGRLYLRIKLAHDNGTDLEALSSDEVDAFKEYMNEIKDAGVKVIVDSLPPDSIRQEWKIFYNPLLMDADGKYIDGTNDTPVQDAIKNYLRNLPFNGVYVPTFHVDAVQQVKGVVFPELLTVETHYGLYPFSPVIDKYTPDAGYLRFDDDADLTITFIAQSPIN